MGVAELFVGTGELLGSAGMWFVEGSIVVRVSLSASVVPFVKTVVEILRGVFRMEGWRPSLRLWIWFETEVGRSIVCRRTVRQVGLGVLLVKALATYGRKRSPVCLNRCRRQARSACRHRGLRICFSYIEGRSGR